ncbi:MAG TPA: hypothetical protein VKA46_00190 [Gemmataceae bacterium]|nr:hypothetical protein [Gemmataceae bacterium]
MSRKLPAVAPSAPARAAPATPPTASPAVRSIPDDAVHQLSEWQAILGLPTHTLKREARLGRLRVAKRAGRLWSLGAWVREWLKGGEVRRPRPETNGAN